MSLHSEDWAKLGTGALDWLKAHPQFSWRLGFFLAGALSMWLLKL